MVTSYYFVVDIAEMSKKTKICNTPISVTHLLQYLYSSYITPNFRCTLRIFNIRISVVVFEISKVRSRVQKFPA